MARRSINFLFNRAVQRTVTRAIRGVTQSMALTVKRAAVRAGLQAIRQTTAPQTPDLRKSAAKVGLHKVSRKSALPERTRLVPRSTGNMRPGVAGLWRYRLYKPPGLPSGQRVPLLPLLVMLHGCTQNANSFADASGMNRIAAREGFMVLYPEQDRAHNLQGCWNWFDTRSGRAGREADAIEAAISQVCQTHPIDTRQIAIAGFSAGAGMAALLATREPQRFKAVIMHSGIGPGVAMSSATALSAMRGRRTGGPLRPLAGVEPLPPLLVIQGMADGVVAPSCGRSAAERWAAHAVAHSMAKAQPTLSVSPSRTVQRGKRHSASVTDYRLVGQGRAWTVATLCEVDGLGHAWSGGAPGMPYCDATGPDASRRLWAFAARQFASAIAASHNRPGLTDD